MSLHTGVGGSSKQTILPEAISDTIGNSGLIFFFYLSRYANLAKAG